jgi:hypothetical protein
VPGSTILAMVYEIEGTRFSNLEEFLRTLAFNGDTSRPAAAKYGATGTTIRIEGRIVSALAIF